MKHQDTAQQIIKAVGGKDNINSVYHCVTRPRFDLKSNEKVDNGALKQLDKVMGTNISGDQFQVIIGNDVSKVFDAMVKEEPSIQQNADNKQAKPEKSKNVILNIFETIAGVFAPIFAGHNSRRYVKRVTGPVRFTGMDVRWYRHISYPVRDW